MITKIWLLDHIVMLWFLKKFRGVTQAVHHTTLTNGNQDIKQSRTGELSCDNGSNAVDQYAGFDVESIRHFSNNILGPSICKIL